MSGIPKQPLRKVEVYDSILRWTVPSRTGKGSYVVDLGHYDGHGACPCTDFATRFEKFLKRGLTPEQVHDEKWLDSPLRDYQMGPEDCLSCWHVTQARRKLARHVAAAFSRAERAQTPPGETHDGA